MWGPGGGDTDLTMGLCSGPLDLRRRGSDSDCFNLRQRQHHQDQTARRDSELFAWHEARRRSSGYSHELREIRETRESSPRNKAAIMSGAETAPLTGFYSLNSDPLDIGFAGVKNIEDASQK